MAWRRVKTFIEEALLRKRTDIKVDLSNLLSIGYQGAHQMARAGDNQPRYSRCGDEAGSILYIQNQIMI